MDNGYGFPGCSAGDLKLLPGNNVRISRRGMEWIAG